MESRKTMILITGCARSGTSMTAGIINLCGAWGGKLAGPTAFNAKGMFENTEIRNNILKPILRKIGADPLGQKPLPKRSDGDRKINPISLRRDVLYALSNQGYIPGGHRPFYKGAKIILLWELWNAAFPEATFILVRRKKEDIAASCLRTGFMRKYSTFNGWISWVEEHERRMQAMKERIVDIHEVWPQRMIDGDLFEIKKVVSDIGLEWNEDVVKDFIEPRLWGKK